MLLSGTGITAGTFISAVTVNASFVVTAVTMSAAMTVAAATTVTTSKAGVPSVVPVWGSPQEGDGTASGTGTAPAVCVGSIVFSGSPSGRSAGTATFAGVVITPTYSDNNDTQANNLAAAINASTAAGLTFPAQGGSITGGYLKAVFYARGPAGGAAAGTCEIMCRIATAAFNSAVITGASWNGGGTVTYNAFDSAGVAGPFGLFFNNIALPVAASAAVSAAGTYGGVVATLMGAVAAGDVIHVRTGRASASIEIDIGDAAITCNTRSVGTVSAYLELRFDNGVVWSDGSSSGVFTINKSRTNQHQTINILGYTYWHGQMFSGSSAVSGGVVNSKISSTYAETVGYLFTFKFGSAGTLHTVIEGMETYNNDSGSASFANPYIVAATNYTDPYRPSIFKNCKFYTSRANNSAFYGVYLYSFSVECIDCLFNYSNAVTTYSRALCAHAVADVATGAYASLSIRLVRPKFSGGGGGHHALLAYQSPINGFHVALVIEDPVDMGQFLLSDSAASLCGRVSGMVSGVHVANPDMAVGQFISSSTGNRDFLIDTPRRLLEWRSAGFPTSGLSTLPDGTPFSIRFSLPHIGLIANAANTFAPAKGIKQIALNTLGDATLTLTEHLLIDDLYGGSSYTPTNSQWWLEGQYVSSVDGSLKTFTTQGSGASLTADSTTTWSVLTYAPFSGGSRTYSRWTIAATLTDVADATEVSCYLMCAKQPSDMTQWCFIDPQFELAI